MTSIALGAVAAVPYHALAQNGAAGALYLDPSVRAAGMGGAATGVSWGGAPDTWANPALRAFFAGVGYSSTGSPIRDAGEGVTELHAHSWSMAGAGVGVSVAGRPMDLGGSHLESNLAPTEIGRDGFRESLASAGVGVSLSGLLNAWPASPAAPRHPRQFGRVADVDFGYSWKRDALATGSAEDAPVAAGVAARDRGLLLRVTPYSSVDDETSRRRLERAIGGARLDLTFGGADLNYTRAPFTYSDGRASRPVSRADRYGWTMHVTAGYVQASATSRLSRWLAPLSPLVSFGRAWDHATWTTQGLTPTDPSFSASVVEHAGWELTLASVLSLRGGRILDHTLAVEGVTSGTTIALPLARYGGIRWDRASTPTLLPGTTGRTVHRNAVSVWVAPSVVLHRTRST